MYWKRENSIQVRGLDAYRDPVSGLWIRRPDIQDRVRESTRLFDDDSALFDRVFVLRRGIRKEDSEYCQKCSA